jgi:hypothetical protein
MMQRGTGRKRLLKELLGVSALLLIGIVASWSALPAWAAPVGRAGPAVGGILVEPLEIQAQLSPGSGSTHAIEISNYLPDAIHLGIAPMDAVQQGNGVPEFIELGEAGEQVVSCGRWLSLSETSRKLSSKERIVVNASIKTPKDAKGDRLCVIMVELRPPDRDEGAGAIHAVTGMVLRYAVIVKLSIAGPQVQQRVGLRQAGWIEEQKPTIRAEVANLAETITPVEVEAVILNESGSRIVDRLQLNSPKANLAVLRQQLYPGGYLTFSGAVKKQLAQGAYQTRVVVRYGNNRTLVSTLPLVVAAADNIETAHDRATVAWEQEPLDLTLAPQGRRAITLALANPTGEPANVSLSVVPRGELCDGWAIDLPPQVTVPPGMRYGVGVTILAGSGVKTQCTADVTGRLPSGESIEPILLRAAQTTMKPQAEVSALSREGRTVAARVKNTGPLALMPTVVAQVTGIKAFGEPAAVPLLSKETPSLGPGEEVVFTGVLSPDIEPGRYRMSVLVQNDSKRPFKTTSDPVEITIP